MPENEKVVFDIEVLEEGENEFGRYVEAEGRLWVNGKKIYHVPKIGMRLADTAGYVLDGQSSLY